MSQAYCDRCKWDVKTDNEGKFVDHSKCGRRCSRSGQFPQQPEGKEGETCATTNKNIEPKKKPVSGMSDINELLPNTELSEPSMNMKVASNAEGEVPPSSSAEPQYLVQSADYWKKLAAEEQSRGFPSSALICMTNAFNHLENALYAKQRELDALPSPSALHEALRRYREATIIRLERVRRESCLCTIANEAGQLDRCSRCWEIIELEELLATPLPSFVGDDTKRAQLLLPLHSKWQLQQAFVRCLTTVIYRTKHSGESIEFALIDATNEQIEEAINAARAARAAMKPTEEGR